MKKRLTYEEAYRELEELVKKIEEPQSTLTDLKKDISRAMELVALCKKLLRESEAEINQIED